ncbi:MAG: ComF family protein [Candidatus Pacebacteria bacterium]|nr:ComF family protein [Candidatus Paceibacterota bacterium]
MKNLEKLKNFILDILFPIKCLGCGIELENAEPKKRWICPECLKKNKIRENQVCPACEQFSSGGETHYRCKNQTALDGLWVATEYKYEAISEVIHKFKFNFIKDISFPLSEILIKSILEVEEYGDFQDLILANFSQESEEEEIYIEKEKNKKTETIIVPIPLYKNRYNWRGFNQAFLLSKCIADKFNLDIYDNLLFRRRSTKPQAKIRSMEKRKKNIKGAFFVSERSGIKNLIKNKNIVIVDDVCTTSATLGECAKELKKNGAKNVWGLVVARR